MVQAIEEVSGGGVVDDEDTLCNPLNGPNSWYEGQIGFFWQC